MIIPRALPSAEWEEGRAQCGHSEFDIPVRWWSRDIERQLEGGAWRQEKGQIAIFNPLKGCQVEKE